MPGVFVSYCRSSAQVAEQVTTALSSIGYDVWRDDQLPAHRAYGDVIEENLRSAQAVVVLWSAEACQSQWVRAEADFARQAETLVQASLDGTIPPLPFNQIQCADLSGWEGDAQSPGWRKIEQSVAALAPIQMAGKRGLLFPDGPSICVLPFENMSGDTEQEYFSDGISEDITTDLSQASALSVVARNTAFTFKGCAVDVTTIARKLGVSHVLEGSVRKAGDRVRITAQLIDGITGNHVWAERFDRDLTDIFAIQDEISKAIVSALKLKLLPEERAAIEQRGTTNAEAYNHYLMARNYWINGAFGDRRREERVIRLCQRAVEDDPEYAQAWALMSVAQANLRYAYSGKDVADDGLSAAETAMRLDPKIAEARMPLAWHLIVVGQLDKAEDEIQTALRLNPDCWEANKEAARILYRQRRLDEAVPLLEKACALAENDFHSLGMLAASYLGSGNGRFQASAERLVKLTAEVLEHDPENSAAITFAAWGHAAISQFDRARELIDRAMLLDPDNFYTRYNLASAWIIFFKDHDAGIDLLGPALARAGATLVSLAAADPNIDPVRDDPRFTQMLASALKRVGLTDPAPAIPAATSAPLRS